MRGFGDGDGDGWRNGWGEEEGWGWFGYVMRRVWGGMCRLCDSNGDSCLSTGFWDGLQSHIRLQIWVALQHV